MAIAPIEYTTDFLFNINAIEKINEIGEVTNELKENVNGLIDSSNAVVLIGMDSLTAGGSGASSFNTFFQNYMRGAKGFGGLYLPFASFMQFTPADYAYNLCSLYGVGSGRKWVDDIAGFTDVRKVNSVNGLGFYYDGTQTPTGNGFGVNIGFKYTKIRVFYRQHPSGGTFKIDQPTYGQAYANVSTAGTESLQFIDVSLYRDDTVISAGTSSNVGYNLRFIDIAGDVQIHGCLILTGDDAPVIVNDARSGRKLSDYVAVSSTVRSDFINYCGVTHALFNAGTNDAASASPAVFKGYLTNAVQVFSDNKVKTYIIIPNYNNTSSTAQYKQAYLDVAIQFATEIYDIPTIWGNYASFVSKGWMFDSTHPNNFFTKLLGQSYSNLIVKYSKYAVPVLL